MTLKCCYLGPLSSQSFSLRFVSDIHSKMGHSELTKDNVVGNKDGDFAIGKSNNSSLCSGKMQ